MIYQLHEAHGKHIAYTSIEAEANIANGWETVSEEEFIGKPKSNLAELYKAKFGKKPHHAMKDSTIQAKLDE